MGNALLMYHHSKKKVITPHEKPTFVIRNKNINVTVASGVEANMTDMKWSEGSKDVNWFASNGNAVVNKQFTVNNYGLHTFYYKHLNRGFVKEFVIMEPIEVVSKYKVARIL